MISSIKKSFSFCLIIILFLNLKIPIKALGDKNNIVIKQDLLCLTLAYPEYITGFEVKENGIIYINMKSGKKILYDDKKTKSIEEKINNADLQDTLEQLYPLDFPTGLMEKNYDPGRFRNYELLKEVYGSTKSSVEANLKKANIGYAFLQFNGNNNAAKELSAAVREAQSLGKDNIRRALYPTCGTFNYRNIAGTNRLSPHAFGIAIDLASSKYDYWKWASIKEGEKRLLTYPKELVSIFENHNFIWGGKWNHFDILHFEYRPEVILKARYFSKNIGDNDVWYKGIPLDNLRIKEVIENINKVL
ncbi:M15 family metallopeptidase [Candidatus Clostridium radicumherbarum]|uniref:M15 family metallopeptidase n=1 Tax=Candidatus Clostridium radicumherbarum TaxID=3381662 RepID=A0ABW8TZA1_9CLOT